MSVVMAGALRRRAGEGREPRPPGEPTGSDPTGSLSEPTGLGECGRCPPHPRRRGRGPIIGDEACPRSSPRFDPGWRGREALCGRASRAKRGPAPGPLRRAAAAVTGGGVVVVVRVSLSSLGVQSPVAAAVAVSQRPAGSCTPSERSLSGRYWASSVD